jgi:gas vesicle protein
MENKNRSLSLLTGIAIGSAIGATVTLLMAPASGEETRYKIKSGVEEAQRKAMTAVDEVQTKTRSLVDNVREDVQDRVSRLKGIGNYVVEEQKATLVQGAKEAKEVIQS